jgi:hypothetical protein
MSNLDISNIINNNNSKNKSNDSIILNKNLKTSMKQNKKNTENSYNPYNENNIESNINKTFCNTNSQIKQAFDFSQIKIDSENSINFNNNYKNSNSNKESNQESISSNSNNNIEIFKINKEDVIGCKIVEDNEQKNAKIMLKSK